MIDVCRHIPGLHTGSSRMVVFSSRKSMQQMNLQMRMNFKGPKKACSQNISFIHVKITYLIVYFILKHRFSVEDLR